MVDPHLEALLDPYSSWPVGVGVVGADGRFRGGNDALCALLGCARGDLTARGLEDLSHPEDREEDLRAARRLLAGEIPCLRQEQRRLDPREQVRWALVTIAAMRGAGAGGFLVQVEDAGSRGEVRGGDRLFAAAERALRLRDEVLRVVSHELRNPLNTIALSTGLLLRRLAPERAEERGRLEMTRRSVERADRLITDLMDFVQLEEGQLPMQPQPGALAPLCQAAIEEHREAAGKRGIRIEARLPDDLPPVLVDGARVGRALCCLVGRAVHGSRAEGLVVLGAAAAGAQVELTISDASPGLSPAELPLAFAPHGPPGALGPGNNIGVALSRGVIAAHGGRLWVARTGPAGTTIALTLPIAA